MMLLLRSPENLDAEEQPVLNVHDLPQPYRRWAEEAERALARVGGRTTILEAHRRTVEAASVNRALISTEQAQDRLRHPMVVRVLEGFAAMRSALQGGWDAVVAVGLRPISANLRLNS